MTKPAKRKRYSRVEFEKYHVIYKELRDYVYYGTNSYPRPYVITAEKFEEMLRSGMSRGFPIDFVPPAHGFPLPYEKLEVFSGCFGGWDDRGSPLLQLFVKNYKAIRKKIPQVLLSMGADPNVQNKHGKTALFDAAVIARNAEMVRLLIKYGADVNLKNYKGVSPLLGIIRLFVNSSESTTRNDAKEVIIELLKAGADTNVLKDIFKPDELTDKYFFKRAEEQLQWLNEQVGLTTQKKEELNFKPEDTFEYEI